MKHDDADSDADALNWRVIYSPLQFARVCTASDGKTDVICSIIVITLAWFPPHTQPDIDAGNKADD